LLAGCVIEQWNVCSFVISECLDQLTDCDTVTQCCSAVNCVAAQTDRHDSVLLKVQFFCVVVL